METVSDTGHVTTVDPAEALREVLFRASVDEPFRQSLLAGELVEIAEAYDVDPALVGAVRFVETATDGVDEIVLPRRIEEGATLTTAELMALAPAVRGAVAKQDTCWLTCTMTYIPPSPAPPPEPYPIPCGWTNDSQ